MCFDAMCAVHNYDILNPPRAYIVIQPCTCPPAVYPHPKSAIFNSFKASMADQKFSLTFQLLNYIIDKFSAVPLSKFAKTCKLLNQRIKTLRGFVINNLNMQYGYVTHFDKTSMSFATISDDINFKKYFNGVSIFGGKFDVFPHRRDLTVVSSFLSNVKSCYFKHLSFGNQILTLNELDKLLGPQIKSFKAQGIAFTDLSENKGGVEKIIERIPNAEKIEIENTTFGSNTSQILANLERSCKLTTFILTHVPLYFDRNLFAEFVKKNVSSKGTIKIRFDPDANKRCLDKFRKALKKMILKEFQEVDRPEISVVCAESDN